MMASWIQRALAGGELAPSLHARPDLVKYAVGVEVMLNAFILAQGGAANRNGLQWIDEQRDETQRGRILPFEYLADDALMLLWENGTLRFYTADGAQLVLSGTPTAWSSATAYVVADLVSRLGVNYYCKEAHTNLAPESNPTHWHALTGLIYEIPSPYAGVDLPRLRAEQLNDLIVLTCKGYPSYTLRRLGVTSWTLLPTAWLPNVASPTNLAATSGGGSGNTHYWKVTAIKKETREESLPGYGTTQSGSLSLFQPLIVTIVAHGYITGDTLRVVNLVGTGSNPTDTEVAAKLVGKDFTITKLSNNTFQLDGTNSSEYDPDGAHTITVALPYARLSGVGNPSSANAHTITWSAVADALEYWSYRLDGGIWAFAGRSTTTTFVDKGTIPLNLEDTPPEWRNPFEEPEDWPYTVAAVQQRLALGGSDAHPSLVNLSRAADIFNLTQHSPLQDDDALRRDIVAKRGQTIRHLVEVAERLVVLTSGAEYILRGDADGVLLPETTLPRAFSYYGSAEVPPVLIGGSLLFVQAEGRRVLLLRYDELAGSFRAADLSLVAGHLFDGRTIEESARAPEPHSLSLWIRDDGDALGLTYLHDQDIWGWYRWTTPGVLESVAALPYQGETVPWFLVKRTINGATRRYLERLYPRKAGDTTFTLLEDARFLDSHLSYDGRNTNGSLTLTLKPGSGWGAGTSHTLEASAATFVAGDVGNIYRLTHTASGSWVESTVTAFTDSTHVTVTLNQAAPGQLQDVATSDWIRKVDEVSLPHLIGQSARWIGDGVKGGPATVSGGGLLALGAFYGVVRAGLAYVTDVQTLPADTPEGAGFHTQKSTPRVTVAVHNSRDFKVGAVGGSLDRFVPENGTVLGSTGLFTGRAIVPIVSGADALGRILIRQDDPLPLHILAIAPFASHGRP